MLKVTFFFGGEKLMGSEMLDIKCHTIRATLRIKSYFSKNMHVIWPGEQFKVAPFFLKRPVYWTIFRNKRGSLGQFGPNYILDVFRRECFLSGMHNC